MKVGDSLVRNKGQLVREHVTGCFCVRDREIATGTRGDRIAPHLSNQRLQIVGESDASQRPNAGVGMTSDKADGPTNVVAVWLKDG